MKILVFGKNSDIGSLIVKTIGGCLSKTDVTDYNKVEKEIQEYQPDAVINCAAILKPEAIKESDIEIWKKVIDVNLIGSYHIAKATPVSSILILISSTAGLHGKLGDSSYCASKAGVISLVQSLAFEGYNAYCISPARMNTKMRDSTHPDEDKDTRLSSDTIVRIIQDIIDGVYQKGDNIIVKKWEGIRVEK